MNLIVVVIIIGLLLVLWLSIDLGTTIDREVDRFWLNYNKFVGNPVEPLPITTTTIGEVNETV